MKIDLFLILFLIGCEYLCNVRMIRSVSMMFVFILYMFVFVLKR